jgi:hypothetical protein
MPAHTTLAAVPPGGDLLESLAQLTKDGDAWLSATGEIEAVELLVGGEGADATRPLKGRFTLLQLAGPSKGPLTVTLARLSDAGIEVLGGVLVRARSAGVSVVVQPAVMAAAAATQASPWAKAAAISAAVAVRHEEPEVEELTPEAGDLVDHFAFGLCEVVTSDGDRLKIRDAKQPGRIREVSMSMLNVLSPTESEGKRLFRLARRGA